MDSSKSPSNDIDWSDRASFWQISPLIEAKRTKSLTSRQPLILSGHGIILRINHGALEVQNGFTHYPQQRETWRIFPGDSERPSRIILLDGSGAITLNVLSWLSIQDIPLIQLDFRGQVVAAIGSGSIGADPGLLRLQLKAAQTPAHGLKVAAWVVQQKLIRTRDALGRAIPSSIARDSAMAQIEADIARLALPWAGALVDLLGLEGRCAGLYFQTWYKHPNQLEGHESETNPRGLAQDRPAPLTQGSEKSLRSAPGARHA